MYSIRRYKQEDKKELLNCLIELQEFERHWDKSLYRGNTIAPRYFSFLVCQCKKHKGEIYVAVEDEKVVGFVGIYIERDDCIESKEKEYALISDLVVLREYRGRGIGSKLLKKAKKHAKAIGQRRLKIRALAQNERANSLYRKFGFIPVQIEYIKEIH